MAISAVQARELSTQSLVELYKERPTPTGFLSSFFRPVESMTRFVSIEVQRGTEKVAVDVKRGEKGNHNKVTRSTQKVINPPYYSEYFGANDLNFYDVAIGSPTSGNLAALTQEMTEETQMTQDKIVRAYELQAANVFDSGVLTLEDGSEIDFGRKAEMIEDLSGTPWDDDAVDPLSAIESGCIKLRKNGRMSGGRVNMICGALTYQAMISNPNFQDKANLRRVDLMAIEKSPLNDEGAVAHGVISAGSYDVVVWTYPQYYDLNGVSTPYIDDKKFILIPENPNFVAGYGAVPQLMINGGIPQTGAYLIQEFINEEENSHRIYVRSAGVMIPVAVDQIYTATVLT